MYKQALLNKVDKFRSRRELFRKGNAWPESYFLSHYGHNPKQIQSTGAFSAWVQYTLHQIS